MELGKEEVSVKLFVFFLVITLATSCGRKGSVVGEPIFQIDKEEAISDKGGFQVWRLFGQLRRPVFVESSREVSVRYSFENQLVHRFCRVIEISHQSDRTIPVANVERLESLPILSGLQRDSLLKWFSDRDDLILVFEKKMSLEREQELQVRPIYQGIGLSSKGNCEAYFKRFKNTHFYRYQPNFEEKKYDEEFFLGLKPVKEGFKESFLKGR